MSRKGTASTPSHGRPVPETLSLYARLPRTRALGPFQRFALWVQGCPFDCPGCMTQDARPFAGGETITIDRLAAEILAVDAIEGLTVSGGEPFAQAAGLAALIRRVRARRDLGLILYTGYRLEELRQVAADDPGVADLLSSIDLLIDGPYVAARNDGSPLRGSANQRVIPLTDRYRDQLHCYDIGQPRAVELHVEIGERMLVGIPSARQLAWWNTVKAQSAGQSAPHPPGVACGSRRTDAAVDRD